MVLLYKYDSVLSPIEARRLLALKRAVFKVGAVSTIIILRRRSRGLASGPTGCRPELAKCEVRLRDSMFGEGATDDQLEGIKDVAMAHRLHVVDPHQVPGLGGQPLEEVVDEAAHHQRPFPRDAPVREHHLDHLVRVDLERLPPHPVLLTLGGHGARHRAVPHLVHV